MNHCFRLVLIVLFLVEISFCNNSILLDDYSADESSILSESHNLTVHLNETVQLPCIVKKSPNTVVIWNQCEDPHCSQMRSPLTINKDNFIQDLRFRIVSENILLNNNNTTPAAMSNSEQQTESNDFDSITKKKSAINQRETNDDSNQQQTTTTSSSSSDDAMSNSELINTDVNSWNLEIRKFSKNDEGCYQCQLNSFKTKTIYYCIKLQSIINIYVFIINIIIY